MISIPSGKGRFIALALLAFAALSFLLLGSSTVHQGYTPRNIWPGQRKDHQPSEALLNGHAIAPKLGNATVKAELGRAAWKVLHTTFARFPEKPTKEEQDALRSYVHLFQRLYPCGDCAQHFGQVLDKYPPQVSSRSAAAMWGCYVHNIVNKRLRKPEFNCEDIGDAYDCGCADKEPKKSDHKEDAR